jgi:hypothetical protein
VLPEKTRGNCGGVRRAVCRSHHRQESPEDRFIDGRGDAVNTKMSYRGYIAISRGIFEHPLYQE